jgi:hypothetical protein
VQVQSGPAGPLASPPRRPSPSLPLALPLRRGQRRSAGAERGASGRRRPESVTAWPAGTGDGCSSVIVRVGQNPSRAPSASASPQPLLSLAMPVPPVIIEPDSLGPWLGLLGVVTGAAITTATNWLQNRRRDRAECESTRTCAGCRLSREFVTTGWLDPVQVGVLQEPAPSMRRQSRERVQRPLR